MTTIDRSIPVPLYYQIAEVLQSQIRSGQLRPGDQIPTERQLSESFEVSRMTVRQAVVYLVNLGVLTVKRGWGTFVAEPKVSHDTLRLLGFKQEIARQGGTVSSTVLSEEVIDPPGIIREHLQLQAAEKATRIIRLREAWGVPLLLERSYISASRCPGLEKVDLEEHSLYAVLADRYGIELVRSRQSIEATTSNDYESKLFGIPEGSPMVVLESVSYDATDCAIEYCRAHYRGDRFRFFAESRRLQSQAPLTLRHDARRDSMNTDDPAAIKQEPQEGFDSWHRQFGSE